MGDENIYCRKKGCGEKVVHEHHYVPIFMLGGDKDRADKMGRVYLCKKHHDILHLIIPMIICDYVPDDKKDACREAVAKFSRNWVANE